MEEQVNLSKGAVLGLRKTEIAPDIAEEVGASVEETCFCSPVPCYNARSAIASSRKCENVPEAAIMRGVSELLKMPVTL